MRLSCASISKFPLSMSSKSLVMAFPSLRPLLSPPRPSSPSALELFVCEKVRACGRGACDIYIFVSHRTSNTQIPQLLSCMP